MKDTYNSESKGVSAEKAADSLSLLAAAFNEYGYRIIHYVNTVVNDKDVSASIVHDCFVEVFNDKNPLPPREKIEAYLFKRAKWRALNYLAREKKKVVDVDINQLDIAQAGPEENIIQEQLVQSMTDEIERMSPAQSRVMTLLLRGMTTREIAEEIGITESTVRNMKARGIGKLRERLIKKGFVFW